MVHVCKEEGVSPEKVCFVFAFVRTEKSIYRSALFLLLLLACGDIEFNPGPGQADKGFSIYQQNLRGLWNNKEVLEHFINHVSSPPLSLPNTSKHFHKNFEKKLATILNNILLLNKETIILGDLNCNYLGNKSNVSLKDLFKLHGFKQIIKTARRIAKCSSTLIDVILTNRQDVLNANSIISSLSDYNVIKCVRKINNIKFNPRIIKCRDYKNYDQTNLSCKLGHCI